MLKMSVDQKLQVVETLNTYSAFPIAIEVQPVSPLDQLVAGLSPDTPWFERKIAAQKLGCMGCPEAVPVLLSALWNDPFWMVRCAVIQALEMIGDPRVIPALQEIAGNDSFQVVRSYAANAIKWLSG